MKAHDAEHEALIEAVRAGEEVAFVNHLLADALREAADELARKGYRSAVTRLRGMASRNRGIS